MPVLEQVLKNYPEKVKIVFKHFPIQDHKFAMKAASAAQAAESYGKFWQFHDLLFKNYDKLNDLKIQDISLMLGLDQAEFKKSMTEPGIQAKVNQDLMDGIRAGVQGTPAVFINGKIIRNLSFGGLQAAIDAELQKLAKKPDRPGS